MVARHMAGFFVGPRSIGGPRRALPCLSRRCGPQSAHFARLPHRLRSEEGDSDMPIWGIRRTGIHRRRRFLAADLLTDRAPSRSRFPQTRSSSPSDAAQGQRASPCSSPMIPIVSIVGYPLQPNRRLRAFRIMSRTFTLAYRIRIPEGLGRIDWVYASLGERLRETFASRRDIFQMFASAFHAETKIRKSLDKGLEIFKI
jgi:hypothetical protein